MIRRVLLLAIMVLAAVLVALMGNGSRLPLDEHEVFVARTAEEMLQRGSVLVPYLNGEPRLTKPPLAYWLTILTDSLGNRDHVISEWEARVPSVVAGILMALATFSLARTLFGRTTAFIAAMLLIASSGFISYTHSARPEMLYAMFCTAALACFAKAWQVSNPGGAAPVSTDETRVNASGASRRWSWLGWLMMGLAILTKGPQLPLLLIGAWCIAMWISGDRRHILKVIRPFSGLLIAAAVSLWWFLIIWTTVERSSATMGHETIGRIFDFRDEPLTRYLDPYYIYRTAGLFLPWMLLYALAVVAPVIREIRMPRTAKLLWWIAVITIGVMHLTLNRRWYYLLPLGGVLAALMAWSGMAVGRAMIDAGKAWIWRALAAAHIIGCAAALGWMWRANVEFLKPSAPGLAVIVVIAAVTTVILFAARRTETATRPMLLAIIPALALAVFAAERDALWRPQRFARRDFDLQVARLVAPQATLLGWRGDWEVEQFYLRRIIPTCENPLQIHEALGATGEAWLLVTSRRPLDVAAERHGQIVHRLTTKKGEELQLWRLTAAATEQSTTAPG